jgi:hypothetical protein
MTVSTYVIARNRIDPLALFDAARAVVGNPQKWTLHDGPDFGDVHMYQTQGGQGADAMVSVHFPAAGGLYPPEDGNPQPDGYAHVGFITGWWDSEDEVRRHHAGLVAALGRWLDAHGVGWCWSYEGDPWIHGHVPADLLAAGPPALARRTLRTATDPGPGEAWAPLIAATGAFDPETDAALLGWMSGEAGGMTGYAEGLAAVYETATAVIGLDPAALAALHDCADAAAGAAEQMAVARRRFTAHYAEVRQFAAAGGVLPFNGRWMTGEGS